MKNFQLVSLSPLKLSRKNVNGSPSSIERDTMPPSPEGYGYVENLPMPTDSPEGQYYVRELTAESYGWKLEDIPVRVVDEVTNYQIKRALNTVPEDRAAVDAFVLASNDQDIIDGWDHAQTFKRDNDLFVGAVVYLGWSQEKVDNYLELAATFD